MANGRAYLLDVTRLIWRRWAGRLPTGIDRVCLAYLDRYRADAQAVIQWRGFRRILSEAASDRLFGLLLSPSAMVRRDLLVFLAGERLRRGRPHAGHGRPYLNVGHTALHDDGFLRWTRAAGVRPIFLVHDLIPITHPEYCRAGEAPKHARRIRNMLASAVGIIGNSRATLHSLAAFAGETGLPLPATLAAPLGSDWQGVRGDRGGPPERPTFVMVGTIEARKNHLMILQLWVRLIRKLGAGAPRLLIIGQRGWECEQVFDLLDRGEILREAVTEIRGCSDAELANHYGGARALLFPSLIEGYGLPLVEALASATPVIASDLPVFHEIGQEIPDFIDPLDGPAWEAAILSYAQEPSSQREEQLARLAAFRPPTWEDHFAQVDAWLETLSRG